MSNSLVSSFSIFMSLGPCGVRTGIQFSLSNCIGLTGSSSAGGTTCSLGMLVLKRGCVVAVVKLVTATVDAGL